MTIEKLNLEQFKLSQNFNAQVGVKKLLTTVPIKKPSKQAFIRVRHEEGKNWTFDCLVLELKEQSETYLVVPEIAQMIPEVLIPKRLYLAIDRQSNPFIWPIKLPDEMGKLDHWNESAHEAAGKAASSWVRVSADRHLGAYDVRLALGYFEEPEWPDLSFEQILEIAFKGRIIESEDHPVLKQLRGEV